VQPAHRSRCRRATRVGQGEPRIASEIVGVVDDAEVCRSGEAIVASQCFAGGGENAVGDLSTKLLTWSSDSSSKSRTARAMQVRDRSDIEGGGAPPLPPPVGRSVDRYVLHPAVRAGLGEQAYPLFGCH